MKLKELLAPAMSTFFIVVIASVFLQNVPGIVGLTTAGAVTPSLFIPSSTPGNTGNLQSTALQSTVGVTQGATQNGATRGSGTSNPTPVPTSGGGGGGTTPMPTAAPTPPPTPKPTPKPTAAACIITVNGSRYDVTRLRKTHSGGDIFVCGTDMTATFERMHGTNWGLIAGYKI